jgi:hypothetical protein
MMTSCDVIVAANSTLGPTTRTRHTGLTRLLTWDWMVLSRVVRTRSTTLRGHPRPSTMCDSRRSDRSHSILRPSCKVARQVGMDQTAARNLRARTLHNTTAPHRIHRQENEVEALDFSRSNARSASKRSTACIRLNNIRRKNPTRSGDASRGTVARLTHDAIHCRDTNSNTAPEDTHVSCANRTTNVRSSREKITLPNMYASVTHRAPMAVSMNSRGSKRRCRTSSSLWEPCWVETIKYSEAWEKR